MTTTDETLLCLTSLQFNKDIPARRICSVSSVFIPEAPHSTSFSKPPQLLSTTSFPETPRWIIRTMAELMYSVCPPLIVRHASFDQIANLPFCINPSVLVLSPAMNACKTTPVHYIATIKSVPPLNQVFQIVPINRLSFPSYSIGATWKSILASVHLELTEIPQCLICLEDVATLVTLHTPNNVPHELCQSCLDRLVSHRGTCCPSLRQLVASVRNSFIPLGFICHLAPAVIYCFNPLCKTSPISTPICHRCTHTPYFLTHRICPSCTGLRELFY